MIAYLVSKYKIRLEEAIKIVSSRRSTVCLSEQIGG